MSNKSWTTSPGACVRWALLTTCFAVGCELYVPLDDYLGERPDASAPSLDADGGPEIGTTAADADEPSETGAPDQRADAPSPHDASSSVDVIAESASPAPTDASRPADGPADGRADGRADALAEVSTPGGPLDSGPPPREAAVDATEASASGGRDASSTCDAGSCGVVVSAVGCSDGTREALVDRAKYPAIAGCEAQWSAASMRAAPTGVACGNSLNRRCAVPANACADGWHVCAIPPYGGADVSAKVTSGVCDTEPGAFAAGIGDQTCTGCMAGEGNGAACCGFACVQQNGICIFPGATRWFGKIDDHVNACGDIEAKYVEEGVLCCRTP